MITRTFYHFGINFPITQDMGVNDSDESDTYEVISIASSDSGCTL